MTVVNGKKEKPCSGKASTPQCGTLLHMAERRGAGRKTDDTRQPKPIEVMDRLVRRRTR